jgi:hypothetical protein
MKFYADTGFLLSLHLPERTSAAAAAAMGNVTEPLPVTRRVALEFRAALRPNVYRQQITEAERLTAWNSFHQDLAGGSLEETAIEDATLYAEAATLCEQFGSAIGVRTLDLLHVANARVLGRTEFLSFDARQRALATAAGLNVLP